MLLFILNYISVLLSLLLGLYLYYFLILINIIIILFRSILLFFYYVKRVNYPSIVFLIDSIN